MELSRTHYSREFREQSVTFFKERRATLVEATEQPSHRLKEHRIRRY